MKVSVSSIIHVFSGGLRLIFEKKRTSRLCSPANLVLSFYSSSSADKLNMLGNGGNESIFMNNHDLLPTNKCFSDKRAKEHDDLSFAFCGSELQEFLYSDEDFLTYKFDEEAENLDIELEKIKLILEGRGWRLYYTAINLDECNIIQILNAIFKDSSDAALALYFFRWSEQYSGLKHGIRSICTMIHILVAGNTNHRAVDLILYLVRMSNGGDRWLSLLVEVLHETHTQRRVLITAYSILVDCYINENMTDSAVLLTCQLKQLNIFPSISVCNSLIRALLRSHQMELAWDFLEEVHRQGLGFNVSILTLFIHKYCGEGNLESGWKLLLEMKNYGAKPDIVAYTVLINSLCRMSLLKEATSLLFKVTQMGIHIDPVSVSSVIDGFCKVGKTEKAIDIMKIFNLTPNIYVYNSFILNLCMEGNMVSAFNVFLEMSELGYVPDCVCHTTMIKGYCKIRDVNSALSCFCKMLKRGIKPTVVTFTTLIDAYCKSGDIDMAEYIFQNIVAEGLAPDIFSYNTLMDGYGKKGHTQKVFQLLDMMRSAGISPDNFSYNIVIHSLIVRGFVSEAKDVLEELTRRGFSPDVVTFTDIMSGHVKKVNIEEVFLVWFYMSEKCIKPDVVTCSALLHGYCKAHQMEEAGALFSKMVNIGLVPDVVLYNTLIHGFCRVGSIDDAWRLVDMMLKQGIVPNDVTRRALVFGYKKQQFVYPVEAASFKMQQMLLKYGTGNDV